MGFHTRSCVGSYFGAQVNTIQLHGPFGFVKVQQQSGCS